MKPTPYKILEMVSQTTGICIDLLKSNQRDHEIIDARGIFYILCKEFKYSSSISSRQVNKRQSTINSGTKEYIRRLNIKDTKISYLYESVKQRLKENGLR